MTLPRIWTHTHVLRWARFVVVLLALTSSSAWAEQRVTLEVQAPTVGPINYSAWTMEAELTWGGESRQVSLAHSGVDRWRGTISGPETNMVGVLIRAQGPRDGAAHLVYSGLEVLESAQTTLTYGMSGVPPGAARRWSVAAQHQVVAWWAELTAIIGVGWWLGVLLGGLGLMRRAQHRFTTGLEDAGGRFSGRWELLIWLVLALAWTWPAALAGPERLVGRHFDALGTIWTISAADRLFPGLADAATGWPSGVQYSTIDSFTLLPISWVLSVIGAVRLHAWLSILGVATSAWAASAFARHVGARRPWSLVAGGLFAFSGLSATALLEGHVYHVMNPWLPLFAWCWWRATGAEGRLRDGVLSGLWFALTVLTTGYLGMSAIVIAVGFLICALCRDPKRLLRPICGFFAIAGPVLGWLFMSLDTGLDPITQLPDADTLRRASVTLNSIGLPTAEADRVGHSWVMVVSPIAVLALLLAPRLLGDQVRTRTLLFTALVGLLMSMGPELALGDNLHDPALPSPLAWIWSLPGAEQLRFPGRMGWTFNLLGGVLAALVATELARRVGRPARWMWAAVLLEMFVWVGLPLRQVSRPIVADGLAQVQLGPVFSLTPEATLANGEAESWMSAQDCLAQVAHGLPIGVDCVRVPVRTGAGSDLNREVSTDLLRGNTSRAWRSLADQGFASMLWRPDWVHPTVARRVAAALVPLGEPQHLGQTGWQLFDLRNPPTEARAESVKKKEAVLAAPVADVVKIWRPLFSLVVPQDLPPARYFVRLDLGGQEPEQIELLDDGKLAGDVPLDGHWQCLWAGRRKAPVEVTVVQARSVNEAELWRGWVQPVSGHEDPIAFRVTDDEQAAQVILPGLPMSAINEHSRAGWIHLLGVLLFGGIYGFWFLARRRQR